MTHLVSEDYIENSILFMRGHKVMLDIDLAHIYCVTPKRLREQVRRNKDRFPEDFMFQLTKDEQAEVAANCGNLHRLKFSPFQPFAFTEHGSIMLASVLNSKSAVEASVQVVRTFVRLRNILSSHKELARKLAVMEKKYDTQFKAVFDAIRQLMEPLNKKSKQIGFVRE